MFWKTRVVATAMTMMISLSKGDQLTNSCTNTCTAGLVPLGVGPSCPCCPILDLCDPTYNDAFCDANGWVIANIPAGCPTQSNSAAGCDPASPCALGSGLY